MSRCSMSKSSGSTQRSVVGALIGALALGATTLVWSPSAGATIPDPPPVVISEVYGGGGNSGAPFGNDFIELYNSGATPVSIDGWSVQYASAGGTSYSNTTPLTGSIAAGEFYIVAEAAGANPSTPVPGVDATGTINLSGTSGKVALVNSTAVLTCGAACSADTTSVVDFVGYGAANDSLGAPTAPLSNTSSAQRSPDPSTNTANNSLDFAVASPTPDAPPTVGPPPLDCGAVPIPAECVPGPTSIQDIQGDGFISPLKGAAVDRVAGVVTAVSRRCQARGVVGRVRVHLVDRGGCRGFGAGQWQRVGLLPIGER
jgi:predicted extracellular nuclease